MGNLHKGFAVESSSVLLRLAVERGVVDVTSHVGDRRDSKPTLTFWESEHNTSEICGGATASMERSDVRHADLGDDSEGPAHERFEVVDGGFRFFRRVDADHEVQFGSLNGLKD